MVDYIVFAIYILIAVVCLYGTGLFIWWWKKNSWRATPMYIYITTLLATLGFRDILDSIAFYQRAIIDCDPIPIYDNWLWVFRVVIVLVIVVIIVGHMSYRAFYLRGKAASEKDEDSYYNKDGVKHV